jgi:hypothetical protein
MICIHPEIEFTASCPNDGTDLEIKDIIIPGIHCLADAHCPTCGDRYYIDLPVGQAIWSPMILVRNTGKVIDRLDMAWFSEPLRQGFLNPSKDQVIPVVHKFFDTDRIIIINCLDFLYGHVLLKLLNVQRHLDTSPDLGCCVLIPAQMAHLVPEGVAEVWEFPASLKECLNWYDSLRSWIDQQIKTRKECFLSPAYSHPSNRTYNLKKLTKNLPDISQDIKQNQPIILFSYREDRLWGRTLSHQQRNLQKLYDQLSSAFPDMLFILIGFGQKNQLRSTGANFLDLRTDQFDVKTDRLWMAYMSVADCAIGIHGSNMLMPSGLAKSTLELVPQTRIRNTVQDFLFAPSHQDSRDALLYYRMLYGNERLSNLLPSTVTDLVSNMLSFARLNSTWFRAEESQSTGSRLERISQETVVQQAIAHLNSQKRDSFFVRRVRQFAEILLAGLE